MSGFERYSYPPLFTLIALVYSTLTCVNWLSTWVSFLFPCRSESRSYLADSNSNLYSLLPVPFPRLHFFAVGYAPLVPSASRAYSVCSRSQDELFAIGLMSKPDFLLNLRLVFASNRTFMSSPLDCSTGGHGSPL